MRSWVTTLGIFLAVWLAGALAQAQDTGATASGNWNDATVWTGGTVPGSSNNVYIGSTTPAGSAATATVTLTANESASNLYLGNGSGTSGTLDLAGNTLTVGSTLIIGENSGAGTINEAAGGSFSVGNAMDLEGGSSFTFGALDQTPSLTLFGSTATTAAAGNVTGNLYVNDGSTVNLGANLSISNELDIEGSGSVLNMNGNNISADSIYLGWNLQQAVTLNRGTTAGSLTATNLYVYGQTFNLLPADSVTNFYLNVGTTTLNSGVAVSSLQLKNGSVGTTTATGNVTGNLYVDDGSTLNLGANLSISNELDVEDSGSILNMNGNNISAGLIELGYNDDVAVTLNRGTTPGSLTASNLYVYGQTFNLLPSDTINTVFVLIDGTTTLNSGVSIPYLDLQNGSTGTTTATGNITTDITVDTGSTLDLGANVSISATLSVQNADSSLNGNGHNIAANALLIGYNGSAAVSVTGVGTINVSNLYMDHGSTATIEGGVVSNLIYLNDGSVLTVDETGGTGLTLNGTLTTDPSSMDLFFNGPGWDFRWEDPASGGNRISAIDGMIASGQIVVTSSDGYEVYDQGGYTYIAAVPEPATAGMALGAAMLFTIRRPRRRGNVCIRKPTSDFVTKDDQTRTTEHALQVWPKGDGALWSGSRSAYIRAKL